MGKNQKTPKAKIHTPTELKPTKKGNLFSCFCGNKPNKNKDKHQNKDNLNIDNDRKNCDTPIECHNEKLVDESNICFVNQDQNSAVKSKSEYNSQKPSLDISRNDVNQPIEQNDNNLNKDNYHQVNDEETFEQKGENSCITQDQNSAVKSKSEYNSQKPVETENVKITTEQVIEANDVSKIKVQIYYNNKREQPETDIIPRNDVNQLIEQNDNNLNKDNYHQGSDEETVEQRGKNSCITQDQNSAVKANSEYNSEKSEETENVKITTEPVIEANDVNKINEQTYSDNEMKQSEPESIPIIPVSHVDKPMGFNNPKGYYYLNCVIQVLASCGDFTKDIENSDCQQYFVDDTEDSVFVKGLFNLIQALRKSDKKNLDKSLETVQQYITESSFGDDVYKCFMNILSRVSKVIKTNIERPNDSFSLPTTSTEKAKQNFEKFKNRNPGFVFDNFYGQLTFQMTCDICDNICNESFQVMKSMPLAVPNSKFPIPLENCVKAFFSDSQIEVTEPLKCACENGSTSVKSLTKLTHGPKYLFIC